MKARPKRGRFLAALCACGMALAVGRAGGALGGESVGALRLRLANGPEMARYEAVKALAALVLKDGALQDDAVAGLLDALGDEACVVRFKAADALAKAGPPVVPHLAGALRDSDRNVRASAARALRAMGPKAQDAVPALEKALRDRDYQVRLWAVDALGSTGPEARAALPAVTRLLRDRERSVRDAVVQALPRIDPEGGAAVPALATATRDRAADVREGACIELGRLGPKAAAAMPALLERLDDDEWQVRKAAAEALLSADAELRQSVTAVAAAFESEKRPFMKDALFGALVKRKVGAEAKPIVPMAIERLRKKSAEAKAAENDRQRQRLARDRNALVATLGGIGPGASAAAPILRELLADKTTDAESRKVIDAALKAISQ